ncbi:hypothetical protein LCGC14_0990570, partial [marine sediment metagenome]
VTTKAEITVARPIGTVARGIGKTKVSAVTIGGKQFTTAARTFKGKEFFIRSKTDIATGKTTTKVFRIDPIEGDVLLKTIKTIQKPAITFTEPIQRLSSKQLLSEPNKLTEAIRTIKTSKGVSLLEKGRFDVTGTRAILSQEVLRAQIISPKRKTFAKIEIDLETGKAKLVPKGIEVFDTRFEFVDFPVKQKPFTIKRTVEGVTVTRPSTTLLQEATRLRAPFEFGFVKRAKPKVPKEIKPPKPKLSDLDKQILKRIREQSEQLKKEKLFFK